MRILIYSMLAMFCGCLQAGLKDDEAYLQNLRGAVGEDAGGFSKANKPVDLAQKKVEKRVPVERRGDAYDDGYELGRTIAVGQRELEESEPVNNLEKMERDAAVGHAMESMRPGQGVLLGLGVFAYLAVIVLAILWVLIPWMVYRIHSNLKVMLGVLKYQTKALEAMNANLISISQQINHFGSGEPISRGSAPAPSARGEAPKTGLRR